MLKRAGSNVSRYSTDKRQYKQKRKPLSIIRKIGYPTLFSPAAEAAAAVAAAATACSK
jgi:hypothetical protein